eukprot:10710903-Prorocentrum_lima.AAC.1
MEEAVWVPGSEDGGLLQIELHVDSHARDAAVVLVLRPCDGVVAEERLLGLPQGVSDRGSLHLLEPLSHIHISEPTRLDVI